MDARSEILNKIRKNKPGAYELPSLEGIAFHSSGDLKKQFEERLSMLKTVVINIHSFDEIEETVKQHGFDESEVFNNVINNKSIKKPNNLEKLQLAVVEGEVGVAENGAIWVTEKNLIHRSLPFICQHLIIVIHVGKIVGTMHEAYELADMSTGYGVFISGPSKTADIEQSLVIGAHGPRSLKVIIIN